MINTVLYVYQNGQYVTVYHINMIVYDCIFVTILINNNTYLYHFVSLCVHEKGTWVPWVFVFG